MGDHLDKIPCAVLLGKSGWRSEHQSRLPPLLQMLYVDWVSVDLNLTSRVSSGHSGFLPPQNWLLKFQFDLMQDLPENHFRVSGASWVNIITTTITSLWRFWCMSRVTMATVPREQYPQIVELRTEIWESCAFLGGYYNPSQGLPWQRFLRKVNWVIIKNSWT